MNDPHPERAAPGERPEDPRSLVDLTINPEEMLRVRDDLRADLLRQYFALLMLARIQRKRGRQDEATRLEARARESAILIWCLDNPMEALTWTRDEGSP